MSNMSVSLEEIFAIVSAERERVRKEEVEPLLEACKRISAAPYGVALGDLEFLNKTIEQVEEKMRD